MPKKFVDAIKFWCTDAGPEMKPACELFGKWQEELGCEAAIFIKCIPHVVLGLESEADKTISSLECKTEFLKFVSSDITSSFLESSNKSIFFTVAYAIIRLLGKSKDSVSYSLTNEFTSFLDEIDINNIFVDIKQARFGKNFLVGRDLSYLLGHITRFLHTHMKENRLYESCLHYIDNCPYLLEVSLSMGILYYHIVYPFMRASGIEGDMCPLQHKDFVVLIPELNNLFHSLYKDPEPLLKKSRLEPYLKFNDSGILN